MARSAHFMVVLGIGFVLLAPQQLRAATVGESTLYPAATPESQGLDSTNLAELADVVRGYVENDAVVGAELLVIKNRRTVLHEAFGWKDRDEKIPMVRNTIFNIRSMTKPVTGTAAQMLIDEGSLSLADPVAGYLPAFADEKTASMTVEHILTHRSGLPMLLLLQEHTDPATTANPIYKYKTLQEAAALGGGHTLDFAPGTAFQYSDAGSEVAGALVEKAAGVVLDTFVQRRILDPLGMRDSITLVRDGDPRVERICSAYVGGPQAWLRYWQPGDKPIYPYALGSQSLYCTPMDYARFLALWMDGGKVNGKQLVSPAAIERAWAPASVMDYPTGLTGLEVHYGQMWMLYLDAAGKTGPDAAPVVFGHGGSDGTGSWAWPELDLMVLYFTQSRGTLTVVDIEHDIDRLLIHPNRIRPADVDPGRFKPYVGSYVTRYHSRPNEEFAVLEKDGQLALRMPPGLVIKLESPDEDGMWRFIGGMPNSVSFERDGDGPVTRMWLHDPHTMRRKDVGTEAAGKGIPAELRKYVGRYLLQVNLFQKKEFAIFMDGKRLALRQPSGTVLKLRSKDERDRWYLAGVPKEYVDFEVDAAGVVTAMRLHQAHQLVPGALPAEKVLKLADVQKYLGFYHDPQGGVDVEVVFEDGRLLIKSPKAMVPFDLRPPDADGKWVLKLNPSVGVRFNEDAEGRVTSYSAITPAGEFERPRVERTDK